MKKKLLFVLLVCSALHVSAKVIDTLPRVFFAKFNDSASYALGYNVGQNLQQRYPNMNVDVMMDAMRQAFTLKPSGIDVNLTNQIMTEYIRLENEKLTKAQKEFLETNKTKEGVITTASGLQYKVLTAGTGAKPKREDVVKVHYQGRLIDGTVFDDSYQRGMPAEFPLTGVIAGWTEGLQYMPVGSKYQLYIPAALGYGDGGSGQLIKPGSTLVFDVELLDIVKQQPAPAAQSADKGLKPTTVNGNKPTTVKPTTVKPKTVAKPVKKN
jgi:FKBP-type peptidyl-prolyl cis-trans isomerase FklB